MVVKAYCLKEKKMQEMVSIKKVKMKNGRPAMKGKCAKCGCSMYKIGSA